MNIHTTSTGRFTTTPDASDIKTSCAKARLSRILSAPIDAGGNWQVSPEDQSWAIRISIDKPKWALPVLNSAGIN